MNLTVLGTPLTLAAAVGAPGFPQLFVDPVLFTPQFLFDEWGSTTAVDAPAFAFGAGSMIDYESASYGDAEGANNVESTGTVIFTQAAPEPAATLLNAAGLGLLGWVRRHAALVSRL